MIMYKVAKRALGNRESNAPWNKIWRKFLMFIMNLMAKKNNLAERAEMVISSKTTFSRFSIALISTLVMKLSTILSLQVIKELPSNPKD